MNPADNADDTPSILLVDAEILARTPIAAYLRECGYLVIEAATTDEAWTLLERRQPLVDIVFCALDTPGARDGFALAKAVRSRWPDIHVVLAGTLQKAAEVATELCDDGPHLRKPYDSQLLVNWIKRLRASARR
ncbi:response regulator receiver domain-containing protein [Tahibacter aquaticus]|uniref:Response regulator receiver domain-containing protein n=1 Tax=Tahibacter aquaticus TaxID=520092 RepID=A0A4R6YTW6_9GAMM|nr:response regulator [Tahibacter aquaticus]TDR41754.1 response regulator receiver domain-containing protein [Tahibacter aquaticus]